MKLSGWIFLITAWSSLTFLVTYCFLKVLKKER